MNIELLKELLMTTSVSEEKIDEYIAEYTKTLSLEVLATLMEALEQNKHDEEMSNMVNTMLDFEKYRNSLDIADEQKGEDIMIRFVDVMKNVVSLKDNSEIFQKIGKQIEDLDTQTANGIMKSLTPEDRKKVLARIDEIMHKP